MNKIEITFNGERLYGLSEVLAYLDKQRERISELEKENAELKEDNEGYEKDNTRLVNQFNQTSAKLTNAKEIIKGLLSFVDSLGNYSGGIFAKAEQFLNCSEKPNN